jgi:hypothetical protein
MLSTVLASVFSRFFYAFFTEKLLSKLVLHLLRLLSQKTSNTLDDMLVAEVAKNLK